MLLRVSFHKVVGMVAFVTGHAHQDLDIVRDRQSESAEGTRNTPAEAEGCRFLTRENRTTAFP